MIQDHSAPKILIIVRGGTIQGVFCSKKNSNVEILDYDDEEFSNDKFAKAEFETRQNNLFELILR